MASVLVLLAVIGLVTAFFIYNGLGKTSKRMDATNANAAAFKKIDDALTQYVMLNQRLPCPASGTAHTGDADPNTATATCNSPSGVVPWNTLGLAKPDAVDSWGRYFFYRVYDGATGFTQANGLALYNCLDEQASITYTLSGAGSTCNSNTHENTVSDFFASKGLTVNDMGTANTKVAYVLISPGESGLGGYYPGAAAPLTAPSSSSKEYLNAGSGGTYWITAPSAAGIAADDATHFDDTVSYAYGNDVAKRASLAGRPWKLYQVFTQGAMALSGTNYNTQLSSLKVQPASAGVNQGPVVVTASASRVICATSTSTQGIAPCLTSVTNGNDLLDTTGSEMLTFDFRVTRKALVLAITDFKYSGGGSNKEQAEVTFYDAAGTQVGTPQTIQACTGSGGQPVGQFTLTAAASFTKFTVRALNTTSGGNSDLGVAAILACKLTSDCPTGTAPAGIGWPTIDCFG